MLINVKIYSAGLTLDSKSAFYSKNGFLLKQIHSYTPLHQHLKWYMILQLHFFSVFLSHSASATLEHTLLSPFNIQALPTSVPLHLLDFFHMSAIYTFLEFQLKLPTFPEAAPNQSS